MTSAISESTVKIPNLKAQTKSWPVFIAASFLVSIPVFFQAPLVRLAPGLSLGLTAVWMIVGWRLTQRAKTQLWGDLLLGFSWSWLAGSIYWGWLRWEPLIHLPVEAIGVPFALWCIWRQRLIVGNWFYLGSLFGTAVTDWYFYLTDLIPHWRELMQVDPSLAAPILKSALANIQTPWGISWAVVLVNILLAVGIWGMQQKDHHWWAFAGAVLSTIFVDSLFWLAAILA